MDRSWMHGSVPLSIGPFNALTLTQGIRLAACLMAYDPYPSEAPAYCEPVACHEREHRVEWSDGESNPDLLNAIQPSSR